MTGHRTHVTGAALLLLAALALAAPATAADPPPTCHGQAATITGPDQPGGNTVTGTSGDDVIVLPGPQFWQVFAGAGNDTVCTADGDDTVFGEDGNDLIDTGAGHDFLFGGPGNDQLYGGLDGSHQGDVLSGGAGDDTMDAGFDAGADHATSFDSVSFGDSPQGVQVDLVAGTATGDGSDTISPEAGLQIAGSKFGDTLMGSDAPEEFYGDTGADMVQAGGGDDYVDVGADNEADTVDAGDGNDTVFGDGHDSVSGGAGDDNLGSYGFGFGSGNATPTWSLDGGSGVDTVTLGVGDDLVTTLDEQAGTMAWGPHHNAVTSIERYRWTIGQLIYRGTSAAETVRLPFSVGELPAITAYMRGGDDRVVGSGGKDYVNGGPGIDFVKGRKGKDTCVNVEEGTC
jgi:Ca2+-binding RTX toxin-like protein